MQNKKNRKNNIKSRKISNQFIKKLPKSCEESGMKNLFGFGLVLYGFTVLGFVTEYKEVIMIIQSL